MITAITPRYKPGMVSLSVGRSSPQARRSSLFSPIHRREGGCLPTRLPLVEQAALKTLNGQLAQSHPFRGGSSAGVLANASFAGWGLSVKCEKVLFAPFRSGESPSLGKEFFNRVRQPGGANLSSKTVAMLSVTDLSASLSRHILEIVPSVGPNHLSVAGLDCVSSGIGLLVGSAVTVGHGISELNQSKAIGDGEGMRRAATQVVSGAISTNASAFSLAYQATAATLAASLGVAADVFLGIGSVANMAISGLAIYRSSCFISRMDGHLESKHLNEKERVLKTLEFLKEKIAPTGKEIEAIVKEIETLYPNQNSEIKIALAKRKILDLAEVKFRYVKRRAGQKTAERVLMEIDKRLERLRDPKSDGFHLASAKELIRLVQSQTKKEILITSLVAVASLIAFTALILGSFFSLGVLPFALYAISSAIALCILLYPLIVENSYPSKAAQMEIDAVALAPFTVVTTGYR